MSKWTHAMCAGCWNAANEKQIDPAQYHDGDLAVCCFCGELTDTGIYYRADPTKTKCGGEHPNDDD